MGGSSYVSSLARRVREAEASSDAAYLKELYHRNDPETIMWIGLTKVSCLRHCTEVKRQESQLRKLSNSAAQLHRTSLYARRGEHKLSSTARTSTMGGSSYFASLARRVREAEASSDAAYLKELYHRNDPETIMWIGLTKVSCLRHCTEVKRQESQLRKLSNSAAQLHRTSLYARRGEHKLSSTARTSTMGGSSYFASLARRVREAEESSDAAYLKELYHRNDPETIMWIGLTKVSCLRHCTEVDEKGVGALIKDGFKAPSQSEHKLSSTARTSTMGGSSYFASLARRVREAEESSDAAYLKELYHRNDPETIMWIGLTKVSCLGHCTEVKRQEAQLRKLSNSAAQLHRTSLYARRGEHKLSSTARTSTMGGSSYFASLARRVREAEESSDAAYLKELYHRNDPETIMWIGLTKVSCLGHCTEVDEKGVGALIKDGFKAPLSQVDEKGVGAISAFRNVRKSSKDSPGTTSAPTHMVTAEGGHFKEQLWRTVRSLGMAFLLISGFGALIEDKGIGLGLHEEVQTSMELNTKVSDVKGVDEAKAELEEIVHYLRDPKLFSCLGVKLPKSVLLVGPLRLGKLCWQELYLEKLVCYFSLAVAVNLKKCLLVLEPAERKPQPERPAIHEDDFKQLLVELDGFKQNEGIIVIAATNFPELLDKALVLKGEDVDLMIIARRTPGFCGADLANLVNFATLGAAMDGAKVVTMADLEHDKDKTMMGMHKGTIVPRGMALGMVSQLPGKDETSISRKQILSLLDISMGERDAEELIFWESEVSSDYETKTRLVIKQEMEEFLERAYNNAKTMLTTHCKELHALANALLEHETLMGSQIKAVLAQSCEEDIMPGKYWQTLPVEQSPIPLCMSSVITCKPFVLGEYAESVLLSMRRLCSKVREAIWVRRIYLIEADSQDNMIEMAFKLTRM
ncbi:UNVERIFIED_CONTAM: ATP-dependent zinc metalloprotease FTSH 4, mitochondrial [Sesamum calycinum]|uniref:ATP-dependent zinc metalloprotease FTSH 4, mitochondrial n=1 Tax=Sesamum calycinum TaxID=2727403 RepID=A0AAW2K716_9LAMI